MMQQPALMPPSLTEGEFDLFRHLIRKHVGISFSRQKTAALQRKLASRVNHLGLESYAAYYRYLIHSRKGARELRQLINSITVERTAFFRHPKQFELLADIALPQMATKNVATKKLRIWSAGCATGQEAYSIAMVVSEVFRGKDAWDIKVLATDIDTNALKIAYKGKYAEDSMREIPQEYVAGYFNKDVGEKEEFYSVKETLREKIMFRRLNFLAPSYPFKSLVDILFCRNVMIYFDMELRKKLISHLFSILQPEGFLFLGGSESLIGVDDRFSLIAYSTYQKTG